MSKRKILVIILIGLFAISLVFLFIPMISAISDVEVDPEVIYPSAQDKIALTDKLSIIQAYAPEIIISLSAITLAILHLVKDINHKYLALIGILVSIIFAVVEILMIIQRQILESIAFSQIWYVGPIIPLALWYIVFAGIAASSIMLLISNEE